MLVRSWRLMTISGISPAAVGGKLAGPNVNMSGHAWQGEFVLPVNFGEFSGLTRQAEHSEEFPA